MTYNITLTDGSIYAVVPDGTVNNQSSMTLIGQNYVGGYGLFQNDNFIRLLENGSNSIAPAKPLAGQLWFDTTTKTLQAFNGTIFKSVSGAIPSATAPITTNSIGDLWFDTTNDQVSVWNGTRWTLIGPQSAADTGAIKLTVSAAGNVTHDLLSLQVDGNIVALVSDVATFAPLPSISGFSNIVPGVNLSTSVNSQTPIFSGTSTNSQLLNNLPYTAFMSTQNNTGTFGTINIYNDSGLTIGAASEFVANVINGSSYITNSIPYANINLAVNNGGLVTTVLSVMGQGSQVSVTGNVGIAGTTTSALFTGPIKIGNFTVSQQGNSSALYFQNGNTYIARLSPNGDLAVLGNVYSQANVMPN